MEKKKYIELNELEVYKLSRQLSAFAWVVYSDMNYEQKKIIGDQFMRSKAKIVQIKLNNFITSTLKNAKK